MGNDVSKIIQLVEIKDFLIAPGLCHQNGRMECWNIGGKVGTKPF